MLPSAALSACCVAPRVCAAVLLRLRLRLPQLQSMKTEKKLGLRVPSGVQLAAKVEH